MITKQKQEFRNSSHEGRPPHDFGPLGLSPAECWLRKFTAWPPASLVDGIDMVSILAKVVGLKIRPFAGRNILLEETR